MTKPPSLRVKALVSAFAFSIVFGGSADAMATQRPFSFRDASYMRNGAGLIAAKTFVAKQLHGGLPMSTALARVRHAGAFCGAPSKDSGQIRCDFTILNHPDGGSLGEDTWTVRLVPSEKGGLKTATFEYAEAN